MSKCLIVYRVIGALIIIRWLIFLKKASILWINLNIDFMGVVNTAVSCLSYVLILIGGIALVSGKRFAPWLLLVAVVLSLFSVNFSLLPFWEYLVPASIKTSPNTIRAFAIFSVYVMNILLLVGLFVLRNRIKTRDSGTVEKAQIHD